MFGSREPSRGYSRRWKSPEGLMFRISLHRRMYWRVRRLYGLQEVMKIEGLLESDASIIQSHSISPYEWTTKSTQRHP